MTYFLHEQLAFPKDNVLLIDEYIIDEFNDIPSIIVTAFDTSKAFEDFAQNHYSELFKSLYFPKTLDRFMFLILSKQMIDQFAILNKSHDSFNTNLDELMLKHLI